MKPKYYSPFIFLTILLFIVAATKAQPDKPVSWTKNYGGSLFDDAASVRATPDGGKIICGTTNSKDKDVSGLNGTANDIWVVKINSTGNIEWQKTYVNTDDESASSIIITSEGGYAIVGTSNMYTSNAKALVIKITGTGILQWQKRFGGSISDRAWHIAETSDGGFAVTGTTISPGDKDFAGQINHGGYDLFVSKLNSAGTLLWSKLYGGTQDEDGKFVKQLKDGNLLVGARAVSNNGDVTGNHNDYDAGDFWVLKLTPNGNVIWKKCYGGTGDETPYSAVEKNGRYYILGTTMNLSGAASGDVNGLINGYDMWLAVLDAGGTLIRQKCIGGTGTDYGHDIASTLDNNFIIGGYTYSNNVHVSRNHGGGDFALIKVDSTGSLIWANLFGSSESELAISVAVNADSSYSILGRAQKADGDVKAVYGQTDIWLVNQTDTSMYQDLYAKLTGKAEVYVKDKINFKLNFRRNNYLVATDTVVLQFIKDKRLQLLSSSRPVSILSGDTLFWKIAKIAMPANDSIFLKFAMDTATAFNPDSFVVKTIISPYNTEFVKANNTSTLTTKMRYQNSGISNTSLYLFSGFRATSGGLIKYFIQSAFRTVLDTTKGIIRFIKDSKTDFISSVPVHTSLIGDTVIWNFSTLDSFNTSIKITLKVKGTPVVKPGDTIKSIASLEFYTLDTAILKITATLQQTVIDTAVNICPGSNAIYTTGIPYGYSYRWQVDTGNGFSNINNDSVYVGVTLDTLRLLAPPSSYAGYKYRCVVFTQGGVEISAVYSLAFRISWTGSVSTEWERPGNWSCGVVPNASTDVIIDTGTIIINSSTTIRSLTIKPGAHILLAAGVVLKIIH